MKGGLPDEKTHGIVSCKNRRGRARRSARLCACRLRDRDRVFRRGGPLRRRELLRFRALLRADARASAIGGRQRARRAVSQHVPCARDRRRALSARIRRKGGRRRDGGRERRVCDAGAAFHRGRAAACARNARTRVHGRAGHAGSARKGRGCGYVRRFRGL